MASDAHSYIANHLLSTKSLPVSEPWLSQFLASQRSTNTPFSALTQTALFRLLASDFTHSLSTTPLTSNHLIQQEISNPAVRERRLQGPIPVQVLDIEDIGSSVWSQVEAIERIERGEEIRGREIIRTVAPEVDGDVDVGNNTTGTVTRENDNANAVRGDRGSARSSGPHRLVLQDANETKIVAIELEPVEGIKIGEIAIGAKLLVKNATVGRGVLLLEPGCVTILGGKIETLEKEWKSGRKNRLLARLGQIRTEGRD